MQEEREVGGLRGVLGRTFSRTRDYRHARRVTDGLYLSLSLSIAYLSDPPGDLQLCNTVTTCRRECATELTKTIYKYLYESVPVPVKLTRRGSSCIATDSPRVCRARGVAALHLPLHVTRRCKLAERSRNGSFFPLRRRQAGNKQVWV